MTEVRRYEIMNSLGAYCRGGLNTVILDQGTVVVLASDYAALSARVQAVERELGELKEKAYRYAHWTPEHTIEEWLADRQRIVEVKQVEADAALRQQLTAMTAERDVMSNSREALVEVVRELRQQLAEAQGRVEKLKNDPDYQQCCELRKQAEQHVARLRGIILQNKLHHTAPCCLCGYNGPGYYQPDQHECMRETGAGKGA